MARQIYFRGEATPARVNVPQRLPDIAGATAAMNSRPTPATELVKSVADAGQKIAGAYINIAKQRMEGHIEDAALEAKRRFGEWRTEYNRTHQAADALDAQADYQQAWNSIAEDVTSRYGSKLEGGYHHLLARKLELGRLYANEDGAQYQNAQYKVWGDNQEKVQLSNLDQMVRDNPYDAERIDMEKAEAVRAWRVRNPGQDPTVFERGLETGIATGRIAGMMAKDDLVGASAALEDAHARGILSADDVAKGRQRIESQYLETLTAKANVLDVKGMEQTMAQAGGPATPTAQTGGSVPGLPKDVADKIAAAAKKYGVDPVLAQAVAMQESNGRQSAVSPTGARGIFQILPSTWNGKNGKGGIGNGKDIDDADANIDAGVRYLKQQLKWADGNVDEALMGYNWGRGNVLAHKKNPGFGADGKPITKEASEYAGRVRSRIKKPAQILLSEAARAKEQVILQNARAGKLGEELGAAVMAKTMTPAEAYQRAMQLGTPKEQNLARQQISSAEHVLRQQRADAENAAYMKVGDFQERFLALEDPAKAKEMADAALLAAANAEGTNDPAAKVYHHGVRAFLRAQGYGGKAGGSAGGEGDKAERIAASITGLAAFRREMDRMDHEPTEKERVAMIRKNGIVNAEQIKDALAYEGWRHGYSYTAISQKIDTIGGKGKVNDTTKEKVYQILREELRDSGTQLEGEKLKNRIGTILNAIGTESGDTSWFGRTKRYYDMPSADRHKFRPDVPRDRRTEIENEMMQESPWIRYLPKETRAKDIEELIKIEYARTDLRLQDVKPTKELEAKMNAAREQYNKGVQK